MQKAAYLGIIFCKMCAEEKGEIVLNMIYLFCTEKKPYTWLKASATQFGRLFQKEKHQIMNLHTE